MKLPTIKRKLPEVFTDETNYFGRNQSWIDTWHSCKPASFTARSCHPRDLPAMVVASTCHSLLSD